MLCFILSFPFLFFSFLFLLRGPLHQFQHAHCVLFTPRKISWRKVGTHHICEFEREEKEGRNGTNNCKISCLIQSSSLSLTDSALVLTKGAAHCAALSLISVHWQVYCNRTYHMHMLLKTLFFWIKAYHMHSRKKTALRTPKSNDQIL